MGVRETLFKSRLCHFQLLELGQLASCASVFSSLEWGYY